MSENLNLREIFPPTSYDAWKEAAEKLLKGRPFESLIKKTYEGINVQPIYMKEAVKDLPHMDILPGQAPFVRGNKALQYISDSWKIAQEIPYADPKEFNEALKYDLARGLEGVTVSFDKATWAGVNPGDSKAGDVGNGGLSIASLDDVKKAFDGVDFGKTPVYLNAGASGTAITALLAAYLKSQGKSYADLKGCVGADPLEYLAVNGSLPLSVEDAYKEMAQLVSWAKENAPELRVVAANTYAYNNSGGNAVQDVAFAIATAVEYIAALQEKGLSIDDIAGKLAFGFSVGNDFFMEIAKLRAVKLVWAKVVDAFGGSDEAKKIFINVRTSKYNKTVYDPYVNMLRVTTEAFSGVLGGCNTLHVGPFDEPIGLPSEFTRRVARNVQLLLKDEWNSEKVVDPAGGSWYVEALTDEIAKKAWDLFKEIEKKGGMFKALQEGFPQSEVEKIAVERKKNLATRKDVFVGTNQYPNLQEEALTPVLPDYDGLFKSRTGDVASFVSSADAAKVKAGLEAVSSAASDASGKVVESAIGAAADGATIGDLNKVFRAAGNVVNGVQPLNIHRVTEMFEELRAKTEAYTKKNGSAPKIFLANMGPIPQHKARADFATGFFSVGAFEMMANNGFKTVDEAADAAINSGAGAMVICSTDATYPEIVPELTKKVKEAKPDMYVILAGYPKDQIEGFKEAGVDDFIHVRANLFEILKNLQNKLGVE